MNPIDPTAAKAALQQVSAAFPETPVPHGLKITRGGTWFDERGQLREYDDPQAQEVGRFFARRPWMEIPGDELLHWRKGNVAYIFLTSEALAYYLPAYLQAFMSVPFDGVACAVLEAMLSGLTPAPLTSRTDSQAVAMESQRRRSFETFVNTLTAPQKAATAAVLEVFEPMFEEEDIENPVRTALDAYWRQFVPRSS